MNSKATDLRTSENENSEKNFVKNWFNRYVIAEKLNNVFGFIIMSVFIAAISFLITNKGTDLGILLIGLFVGIPLVIYCIINYEFAILFLLAFSFFLNGVSRFVENVQLGALLDSLLYLLFFILIIKQIKYKNWSFIHNPVGYLVLAWILFNILQLVNPDSTSKEAWMYTIRSIAGLLIIYYLVAYSLKSIEFVEKIFRIWIFLAFLAAIYGLYQEFVGFQKFELDWIMKDEARFKLLYNWGRFRMISYFNDPTVFGILMAYTSVFCFVLAAGDFTIRKRIWYIVAGSLMMFAMVYSGTRTAFAILPAGFAFYAVLTLNRKTLIVSGVFLALGLILIFGPFKSLGPISSNNLARIRSAFTFEEDRSFQFRLEKQAFIQPYIRSHPVGAGLGSTGSWGQRFSPHTLLATFGPDSGYVRTAVEQGWGGLLLFCCMLFFGIATGIKNYFKVKDPRLKTYYIAVLTVLYCLVVANYPQQAIIMYPTVLIFYICLALAVKMIDLEPSLKKTK